MFPEIKEKMLHRIEQAVGHLATGLAGIRTGRASLLLFDNLSVDYYGTATPLKQMANLSTPDSRTVLIQPWDISQITAIEKAILSSGLGFTPSNDGKVVRLTVPPLTEERRKEMVKWLGKLGEECKVQVRNARRETNDAIKAQQKQGDVPEDSARKYQDEAQKLTDQKIAQVEEMLKKKEKDILEV
jgi:ribosome recycling factor